MAHINIGLIGCGFIGRFHSVGIRAIARRELLDITYAAVCDSDEQRARSFAAAAGVPAVLTDAAELISSPDIDAVYNPLPNHLHDEWTRKAADAGKHILCEKPLTPSAAATRPPARPPPARGFARSMRCRSSRRPSGTVRRRSRPKPPLDPPVIRIMAPPTKPKSASAISPSPFTMHPMIAILTFLR